MLSHWKILTDFPPQNSVLDFYNSIYKVLKEKWEVSIMKLSIMGQKIVDLDKEEHEVELQI